MKLTKTQLKQIIKEELDAVLSEPTENPLIGAGLDEDEKAFVMNMLHSPDPDAQDAFYGTSAYGKLEDYYHGKGLPVQAGFGPGTPGGKDDPDVWILYKLEDYFEKAPPE